MTSRIETVKCVAQSGLVQV